MIKEVIFKELSKKLIEIVTKSIKNTGVKFYSKEKDIIDSLTLHLQSVNTWSSEVNFSDLKHVKSTTKVYVELQLYFQPLRVRISESEKSDKFELKNIFKHSESHIALLGQVGSGKTTSLKYFCQSLLFNDGFFENQLCYPILIKLNEFNSLSKENDYSKNIIFDALIKVLGIKFDFHGIEDKSIEDVKEAVLVNFLNENKVLLLLDGFDEITFKNRRDVVLNEFENLSTHVYFSKIVLTSRTSDYRYSFSNVKVFEICSLNDEQIEKFAEKWLESEADKLDFLSKIKISPFYDTAIRPLTIAHLCALYERNKNIPEKPKTVYRKIVMLLLEEWNQQRNIFRPSKYAKFENDRKFDFLSSLAFNLTTSNSSSSFSKQNLKNVYYKIYQDFDLEKEEMTNVIDELESHNGLILQSGFEKYEFAHKSIQEYLTAEYIVRLPKIPETRNVAVKLPNEFAVAIAISSKPSEYFIEFVETIVVNLKLGGQFIKPFVSRLLLEKVDFNKHINVTISALKLYSIYIQSEQNEMAQLSLFYVDDLILQFEHFIEEIFKRNDKNAFFEYYEVTEEVISSDGIIICVLQLLPLGPSRFPKKLYCRKSFIQS